MVRARAVAPAAAAIMILAVVLTDAKGLREARYNVVGRGRLQMEGLQECAHGKVFMTGGSNVGSAVTGQHSKVGREVEMREIIATLRPNKPMKA